MSAPIVPPPGEPIEVACASRRDYLPHTATMLSSLLANGGAKARVHLLVGDDVDEPDAEAVASMVAREGGELIVHRMRERDFAGLKTTRTLPAAHWYRVCLPELLAGSERALYLDSDLLVLDSLLPLWRLELDGRWLAAATNVFPDVETAAGYCEGLGVDPRGYFNSGVMLLDLHALREAGSTRRVLEFARGHGERLILPEQDAMNAVVGDRRLPLAPRWNSMVGVELHPWSREIFGEDAVREAVERPAIRHFEGSANKPWAPGTAPEIRALWDAYRVATPWPQGSPVG